MDWLGADGIVVATNSPLDSVDGRDVVLDSSVCRELIVDGIPLG